MVTSKNVGLAVPDWPTTFGYNMFLFPISKWVGGILFEHTHRLMGSLVGFLTIILAVWLWLREDRRWVRSLGVIAIVGVILQGILGGLRVTMMKDQIGIFHACVAQAFLGLLVFIALVTTKFWRSLKRARAPSRAELPRRLGWIIETNPGSQELALHRRLGSRRLGPGDCNYGGDLRATGARGNDAPSTSRSVDSGFSDCKWRMDSRYQRDDLDQDQCVARRACVIGRERISNLAANGAPVSRVNHRDCDHRVLRTGLERNTRFRCSQTIIIPLGRFSFCPDYARSLGNLEQ